MVHTGPCTCAFLYLVDASLRRSALFYLVLASAALLGVGWRGGSSNCKILLWPAWFGLRPLLFLVLQGVWFHTLVFQKLPEDSAPLFRVTLNRLVSDNLGWVSKLSEEFDCTFCASWRWGSVPIFPEVSWDFPLSLNSLSKRVSKVLGGAAVVPLFSRIAQSNWLICLRSPSSWACDALPPLCLCLLTTPCHPLTTKSQRIVLI